jgi:hypothetical protein
MVGICTAQPTTATCKRSPITEAKQCYIWACCYPFVILSLTPCLSPLCDFLFIFNSYWCSSKLPHLPQFLFSFSLSLSLEYLNSTWQGQGVWCYQLCVDWVRKVQGWSKQFLQNLGWLLPLCDICFPPLITKCFRTLLSANSSRSQTVLSLGVIWT